MDKVGLIQRGIKKSGKQRAFHPGRWKARDVH